MLNKIFDQAKIENMTLGELEARERELQLEINAGLAYKNELDAVLAEKENEATEAYFKVMNDGINRNTESSK